MNALKELIERAPGKSAYEEHMSRVYTRSAIKRSYRMKIAQNQIVRLHNQNKRTHKQIRTAN